MTGTVRLHRVLKSTPEKVYKAFLDIDAGLADVEKVLAGKTKGYKHHPQLQRFKASKFPKGAKNTGNDEISV